MTSKKRADYLVTLTVEESDSLRRVALLNSAMFRLLRVSQLIEVKRADYRRGTLVLKVDAEECGPELVPGRVTVQVDPA